MIDDEALSTHAHTIRSKVLDLYDEVDSLVSEAGPKCDASGRCCRFKEWDHVLYLTSLEANVLLIDTPNYERPVSDANCPFQIDGLCTARHSRPLGCRIYFCDPNYQDRSSEIMEYALSQLRCLAKEHQTDWHYAPLHVFLNKNNTEETALSKDGDVAVRKSLPLVTGS